MKNLLLLLFLFAVLACNTDDNATNTEIPNASEVTFNLTLFARNNEGDYLSFDVIKGNLLSGPENLSTQSGFPFSPGYNVDGNWIIFFDRFFRIEGVAKKYCNR